MVDLLEGKNEKQFAKWLTDNYGEYVIEGKKQNQFFYSIFSKLPPLSQAGIIMEYLDEYGYFIETFRHHQGKISYKINNSPYYEYSDNRESAYMKAFLRLNIEIENENDEDTIKK